MPFSIDTSELDRLADELGDKIAVRKDADAAFTVAMATVGKYASLEAPRRTGRLARATGFDKTGELQGNLTTDVVKAPYAPAVMYGSKAHEIAPVKAKALRIPLPGGAVFSVSAKIPARAADPYLERTWDRHGYEACSQIEAKLANSIEARL